MKQPLLILALTSIITAQAAENGFVVTVVATSDGDNSAKTVMPNLDLTRDRSVTIPLQIESASKTLVAKLYFDLAEQYVQYDITDGERIVSVGDKNLPVKYAEGNALFEFGKETKLIEMNSGAIAFTITTPEGWVPTNGIRDAEVPKDVRDALEFRGSVAGANINCEAYNPTDYTISSITVRVKDGEAIDRLYDLRLSVKPNEDTSVRENMMFLPELTEGQSLTVTLEKAYGRKGN